MNRFVLQPLAAALLLVPTFAAVLPATAQAQQRAVVVTRPQVASMAVNADEGLSAGSTLDFHVRATPRATNVDVTLGNSGIRVPLRERTAGNYHGSYVVRRADRIDPSQLMAVRFTQAGRVWTRNFSYPGALQASAMGAPGAVAVAPAVERFVMRSAGPIEPGRELRFRLVGAPGADAWLDIPGVIRGVDLVETRPGVYEGTYTVRRRDDLAAFERAVATLQAGQQRATARVEVRERERDARDADAQGPSITAVSPSQGERVDERGRVTITARLGDDASGVDPSSVRLLLDGQDVTRDARITGDEVRLRENLDEGRHAVELSVRDRAGNVSTRSWSFFVSDRDRTPAAGPVPLEVTSHAADAVVEHGGDVTIRGRTAPHATVRVQVQSVASLGGILGLTQPIADQTAQADRNGRFAVTVQARTLPMPGSRLDVNVTATSGSQTAEERLSLRVRQG